MTNIERTRYIPAGALKVASKDTDIVAYTWKQDVPRRPFRMIIYIGKQTRPLINEYYQTEKDMLSRFSKVCDSRKEVLEYKESEIMQVTKKFTRNDGEQDIATVSTRKVRSGFMCNIRIGNITRSNGPFKAVYDALGWGCQSVDLFRENSVV